MAKTLGKETVTAIECAITTAQKAGKHVDLHGIATAFNCTYQSVCYIRRRLEKHHRTGIDDRKRAGRKPLAGQERMAESVKSLLAQRPELDQKAISDHLFDEFGVRVCQATISRMLKKNAIPHKISNKLYKKSKLFTTDSGGKVTPVEEDNSRALAASALSSLPNGVYKSPYPPFDVISAVMTLNNQDAPNGSYDEHHQAPALNMNFQDLPSSSANLVNYMTPFG